MSGQILKNNFFTTCVFMGAIFSFLAISSVATQAASKGPYELKIPLGLDEEAFKVPQDNPMTKEKN